MNELYILNTTSRALIRDGGYCYPCDNSILIQGAFIIGGDGSSFPVTVNSRPVLPHHVSEIKLVFLELSYDPISRIKRGKFYKLADGGQPVTLNPSSQGGVFQVGGPSSPYSTQAYKFFSYDFTRAFSPRDSYVFFGNSRFETRWQILSIDASVTNEEVCVLQEVNSIGVIPSLHKSMIPEKYYSEIEQEYSSLLQELNSSPESVVDHCRDVGISLLSAISGVTSKESRSDLGKLINQVDEKFRLIKSCAEIVNRLHPRRKPNEKDKLSLSDLTRADSDFAVKCIFQIIREMKWHKS